MGLRGNGTRQAAARNSGTGWLVNRNAILLVVAAAVQPVSMRWQGMASPGVTAIRHGLLPCPIEHVAGTSPPPYFGLVPGNRGWTIGPPGATLGLRLTNQPGLYACPACVPRPDTRRSARTRPRPVSAWCADSDPPAMLPGGRGPRRVPPNAARAAQPSKAIPGIARLVI